MSGDVYFVVFTVSNDGVVLASDASYGSEIWTHELHSDTINEISYADGAVYSSGDGGRVIAVEELFE